MTRTPEFTLHLERKFQTDTTGHVSNGESSIIFTPTIDEDYWTYRVMVSETQAVLGFPKFTTIGIGFAIETNWNTNLPYRCTTDKIWKHIKQNKGSRAIPDARCIEAIQLIQAAAHEDRGTDPVKDVIG